MAAPFGATWGTLIERCEELSEDATLITPLGNKRFRITDVQQQRVIIEVTDTDDSRPLHHDQFESLAEHTRESAGKGYELERLPPKAEPYAAVLALHPRYVLNQRDGTIIELDEADESAVLDDTPHLSTTAPSDDEEDDERAEPDVSVYSDALLLIDALERENLTALDDLDTPDLVNLYTLLSDVQRNANDLRKDVTDVLLDRVQHDRRLMGSTVQYSAPRAVSARSKMTRLCSTHSRELGSTASRSSVLTVRRSTKRSTSWPSPSLRCTIST
jgi:Lon protease-like protein